MGEVTLKVFALRVYVRSIVSATPGYIAGIYCLEFITLPSCHVMIVFKLFSIIYVSRKFCQKSLCRRVCVGRRIVSIQNRVVTGMFGSLGKIYSLGFWICCHSHV